MKKLYTSFAAMLLLLVFVGCKLYVPSEIPSNTSSDVPYETPQGIPSNNTVVTFGSFPQTIKKSGITVNESESKVVGMFTYYRGSDGEWYAKHGSEYYKVEPIRWCVLTNNYNGKKLLHAEKVLINCAYYDFELAKRIIEGNTVYPNNYKESRIRAYLNGLSYQVAASTGTQVENNEFLGKGFLQTAFTAEEQAKIATTIVDNSERSTYPDSTPTYQYRGNKWACENTYDKLFLLSKEEYGNIEYNKQYRLNTDFAKANGAVSGLNGASVTCGCYWLRSPHYNSYDGSLAFAQGIVYQNFEVDSTGNGVCPALVVQF